MYRVVAVAFALLAVCGGFAEAGLSGENKLQLLLKLVEAAKECTEKIKISEADIKSFKEFTYPGGVNAACLLACIYKKLEMLDENGDYRPDLAIKNVATIVSDPEELESVKSLLDSCSYVNNEKVNDGEKGCDRSKMIFECIKENGPKNGIDFSSED